MPAGALLPAPDVRYQPPFGSGFDLHPQERPPLSQYTDLATLVGAGAASDTQPVDERALALDGAALPGFGADWYDRIHINPSPLALGNLLSSQVRDIEVWNAYLYQTRDLASVTGTGTDGMELTEPEPAPTTFARLEARTYQAAVSTEGPPTIDAEYTFAFDTGDVVLAITGSRVVIFAVAPDWARGILERLEWLTDVLGAYEGTEQRIGLRDTPRRTFELDVLVQDHEAAWMDALLWGWQARVFAVPVWTDPQRLAAALPAASASITVTTDGYDYHDGGIALLIGDYQTHEAVQINTVSAGAIALQRPTEQSWPAGTRILPARLARLADQQSVRRPTAGVVRARLRWAVEDDAGWTAQAGATTYQGYDVLERAPNRAKDVDTEYRRAVERIDFRTGPVTVDDHSDRPALLRTFEFWLRDRQDIQVHRDWLHYRKGRRVPFWAASRHRDLELTQPVGSASTTLIVRDIGYRLYYQQQMGRKDIALRHRDGTWYYRRITGAAAGNPGEEHLSIDSALGIDADPEDFAIVSFLELVRLDGDAVEIHWANDAMARTALTLRGVAQ